MSASCCRRRRRRRRVSSASSTPASSPQSFTLDVTVDSTGTLTGASINGDSSGFSVVGNTLIGNAGTIYAGMAFSYTGSTSQSITVTSTSGLASQLYQIANTSAGTSGQLQTLISNLQVAAIPTLQSQVNDVQSNAATFTGAGCSFNTPTIRRPSRAPTTRSAT